MRPNAVPVIVVGRVSGLADLVAGVGCTFRVGDAVQAIPEEGGTYTLQGFAGFPTIVGVPADRIEVDYDSIPDEWRRV